MGIGASIFLLAFGAILAFAVTINDSLVYGVTIDWNTVGAIMMVVGALGLLWSLFALSAMRSRNRNAMVERPDDRDRTPGY